MEEVIGNYVSLKSWIRPYVFQTTQLHHTLLTEHRDPMTSFRERLLAMLPGHKLVLYH